MMKTYHLLVFSQDNCPPCERLKEHLKTLPECVSEELDFVPLRTPEGAYTALAEELGVDQTPTLVVLHDHEECEIDDELGDEFCDFIEEPVERFVGGQKIIDNLNSTINSYTYCEACD